MELDAVEFVWLFRGLEDGAVVRAYQAIQDQPPATVRGMSTEAYLAGLRRHRGQVVHAGGES